MESILNSSTRMVIFYTRGGHEDSDYQKQLAEYRQLYGNTDKLTCVTILDFSPIETNYE